MARTIEKSSFYSTHPATVLLNLLGCPQAGEVSHLKLLENYLHQRYPEETYLDLYTDYKSYPYQGSKRKFWRNYFLLEKLTSGTGTYTWLPIKKGRNYGDYFKNRSTFLAEEYRYQMSGASQDTAIASRILEFAAKKDSEIAEHFKPEGMEYIFRRLGEISGVEIGHEEYQSVVGKMDSLYNNLGLFYNIPESQKLCPLLAKRMTSEINHTRLD